MSKIFKCINCGKEYTSRKQTSKFCSVDCKRKYNNIPYDCDNCGKRMMVYRNKIIALNSGKTKHIFCSRNCATEFTKTKVVKTCEYCNTEYEIGYCFKDTQRFCSRECYNNYKNENSKKMKRICPVCNKEFFTTIDTQYLCSNKCKGLSQRVREQCTCEVCGKIFERIKSEVDKNKHHYCSDECRMNAIKWNEHDLNILRKYYNKVSNYEIQSKLTKKWSIDAICRKAQLLGLGIDRKWTESEEQILKDSYPTKSISEVKKLLSNKTLSSIRGKARSMNLLSKFYLDGVYTEEEIEFIKNNYLNMTDNELAEQLNRTKLAVAQKLYLLDLHRPKDIKKTGYKDLIEFMRSRLYVWKNDVRSYYNFTCQVTGEKSNLIIHHIRGFNLLFTETIEVLNFPIYENFTDYTDEELDNFVEKFFEIQDYYNAYTCITEFVHKQFHSIYGYGNNTEDQWAEFLSIYYKKIA